MLLLKRMQYFNELLRCDATGELLKWGDWYYEDTDDGKIFSANYYHEMKNKKREAEFDYSELEEAKSDREYAEKLKKAEQEYIAQSMLEDRTIFSYSRDCDEPEENDGREGE